MEVWHLLPCILHPIRLYLSDVNHFPRKSSTGQLVANSLHYSVYYCTPALPQRAQLLVRDTGNGKGAKGYLVFPVFPFEDVGTLSQSPCT